MAQDFKGRLLAALLIANLAAGCSRKARDSGTPALASRTGVPTTSQSTSPEPRADGAGNLLDAAPLNAAPAREERVVHFAWKPSRARPSEYAMSAPEDQHTIVLLRGIAAGHRVPVVVAFHGQPHRGQAPHTVAFPRTVREVARELVDSGEVQPFALVTPVFRFEGQNWPNFEVVEFVDALKRILGNEGITPSRLYFVGHSGAAGCGGGGLNRLAGVLPHAVGFFDTCVGAGFLESVRELAKRSVPTFIAHSVETAGFQPREPTEYESHFDFGRVYSKLGLTPTACPEHLPDAPLRMLAYRCATNEHATIRALVIDTGEGEKAHEALVPVAFRYFLTEYVRDPAQ